MPTTHSTIFVARTLLPALLLGVALFSLYDAPQPTIDSKSDDSLDSSPLAGWKPFEADAGWTVAGDELTVDLLEGAASATEIVWKEAVADFELRFEARIDLGELSVVHRSRQIQIHQDKPPQLVGYAHRLSSDAETFGTLYEDRGPRGLLAQPGKVVATYTSGERRTLRETGWRSSHVKVGEWQQHVIRASGDRIVHEVDGLCVSDLLDQDGRVVRDRGLFGMRATAGTRAAIRELQLEHRGVMPSDVSVEVSREIEWIWSRAQPLDGEAIILQGSFALSAQELERVVSAEVWMTCDNRFDFSLNGQRVVSGEDWQQPARIAIAPTQFQENNLLRVEAVNEEGPAGLAGRVRIEFQDGLKRDWVTNSEWTWSDSQSEAVAQLPVHSFGGTAAARGPWPDLFVEKEATRASHLRVPAGFHVQRLRSAQQGEGSWVALTFDRKGRCIISPQSGGLLRWQPGPTAAGTLTQLPLELGSAQGLLVVDDDLYVTVNRGRESGFYRARDTDGDDIYDDVRCLKRFSGVGEHGPHGLRLGPDGWIYMVHGNMTSLPDGIAENSPHRNYAEDLVTSRDWDPRGHAQNVLAPGGRVLRTDRDGKVWQLYAGGMRNSYDLAFNANGDLFTFDSDMEWDIGLPWYRPTRVLHLVSGGEYGWRSGSGKWPAHLPDQLPAVVDIGEGSPTGLEFGTRSHFPQRYRHALFIADWTFGRIVSVHLGPRGASYGAEWQTFLQGKGLCVTDMEFGPDGALYLVTGGRGTQSGLYRVSADPPASLPAPFELRPVKPLLEFSLRRELAAHHGTEADASQVENIWSHLGSADPFLSHAARVALEHQPLSVWKQRALAAPYSSTALTALLALARCGGDQSRQQLLTRLSEGAAPESPESADVERLRILELRCVGIAVARLRGDPAQAVTTRLIDRYRAWLGTQHGDLQLAAARVLLQLGARQLGKRLWRLQQSATRYGAQMEWGMLTRERFDELTSEQRTDFFRWLRDLKNRKGGMSFGGYLDGIAQGALSKTPEHERRLHEEFLAADQAPPPPLPSAQESRWQLADLLPHLQRIDRGRSFARGKGAYESALCAACHRFAGEGGTVGPDLTAVGNRFGRRDLLQATLNPSQAISDQYEHTLFTLTDGSEITGRVLYADSEVVRLATDVFGVDIEDVARQRIESQRPSPLSPMPANLLDSLDLEQVLDLMAYLESAGDPEHSSFQRGK